MADDDNQTVSSDYGGPTYANKTPIKWKGNRAHLALVNMRDPLIQFCGRKRVGADSRVGVGGGPCASDTVGG